MSRFSLVGGVFNPDAYALVGGVFNPDCIHCCDLPLLEGFLTPIRIDSLLLEGFLTPILMLLLEGFVTPMRKLNDPGLDQNLGISI